jgi:hypothetical protein
MRLAAVFTKEFIMVMRPDGFLHERIETLYVSPDHQLFLKTGQTQTPGGRRAFVSITRFDELDAMERQSMLQQAKPLDDSARLTISTVEGRTVVYDGFTGTNAVFSLAPPKDTAPVKKPNLKFRL